METLKKVSSNEIYRVANISYDAMYDMLKKILPPEKMIFAQQKVGYSQIFWVHSESGWQSFETADADMRGLITAEIARQQIEICNLLSVQPSLSKMVDMLFTTPGDEYYFYRTNNQGTIDVLITGWGYKKPLRKIVDDASLHIDNTLQKAVVQFVIDGKPVPNYNFSIVLGSLSPVSTSTDAEGRYLLAERAKIGCMYHIEDPLNGKTFDIEVKAGKELYICDVTPEIVPEPALPPTPEPEQKPEVDPDPDPELHPEPESHPETVPEPETEPDPQPEILVENPVWPVILVLDEEEKPVAGYPIEVGYDGRVQQYIANDLGRVALPQMLTMHTMVVTDAIDPKYTSEYQLQKDVQEYIFHVPFTSRDEEKDILIRTEDLQGQPFKGAIAFVQEGRPTIFSRLDDKGQCWLSEKSFATGTDLEANMTAARTQMEGVLPTFTFQLTDSEKEYLLTLKEPTKSQTWLEILLAVLAFLFFLVAFIILMK